MAMETNEERRRAIITLTTDFGVADPYVAAMKGVALAINPAAHLIDISHEVLPQRLLQAVFITQMAWRFFPAEAIHLVVVDPGVGSERRGLAMATPYGVFVGPDNGILSAALPDDARLQEGDGPSLITLPPGYRAVALTEQRYQRTPVSATFHGRDIFAPAAAHLSLGTSLEELGEVTDAVLAFAPLRARQRADGALEARVVHIDRYGNVLTDIRAEDVPDGPYVVEVGGRSVAGPVRTYGEAEEPAALIGSHGFVELAVQGRSAARALNVDIGAGVVLRRR